MVDWLLEACLESAPVLPWGFFQGLSLKAPRGATLPAWTAVDAFNGPSVTELIITVAARPGAPQERMGTVCGQAHQACFNAWRLATAEKGES